MSEQYPTQAEYQELLNEIFAHDPELYNYIMYGEYEAMEIDRETAEIRRDNEHMRMLTQGIQEIQEGKGIAWKERGEL